MCAQVEVQRVGLGHIYRYVYKYGCVALGGIIAKHCSELV